MSPEETPEEQPEKRRRRRRKPAEEAAEATPAVDATAGTPEATEATPPDDAPRSDEPAAAADDETTRGASSADATPEAPADEEQEPEDADEDEESDDEDEDEDEVEELQADADAPAAKPRRRRPGARRAAQDKPDVAPKPAPTRRRREVPAGPPPVVRAQAKYVRSSSRKARLVCDHIRGKSVEEARAILAHTPRAIARDWSKLLESAVANAEHNHELVGEDLYVKAVHADEGPTIKRFRPRAMGRATKIRKRTSHLTILLTPKGN
jgi:ribosomal protein L22